MVYKEKKSHLGFMKKLQLCIHGMLLTDSQMLYYSNFKDIQIIMKILIRNIKPYVHIKKVLYYLNLILYLL